MSMLFPLVTVVLVALGAFCLFISTDNQRRIAAKRTAAASARTSAHAVVFHRHLLQQEQDAV